MKGFLARFEALGPNKRDEPEHWPSEAVNIEDTIEVEKEIYADLHKKITSYQLLSYGSEGDKRFKKFPEYKLQSGFEQAVKECPDKAAPRFYLDQFRKVFRDLSILRRDFEQNIEDNIAKKMKDTYDVTCPRALKARRTLAKSVQNLKSAKEKVTNYENEVRKSAKQNQQQMAQMNGTAVPGNSFASFTSSAQMLANTASSISNLSLTNQTSTTNPSSRNASPAPEGTTTGCIPHHQSSDSYLSKLPSHVYLDIEPKLKEALDVASPDVVTKYMTALNTRDEAEKELVSSRDACLSELYTYKAEREEREQLFLSYFKCYAEYLRDCAEKVERRIPHIEKNIQGLKGSTTFHVELEDGLNENGHSYVIERINTIFYDYKFYKEPGIFRIAGQRSKINLFSAALDLRLADDNLVEACGPYAVADALKAYLRALPTPLLTWSLHEQWKAAMESNSVEEYRKVLQQLPEVFYKNLCLLIELLTNVIEHSDENKMNASNLSLLFGPNLLRENSEQTVSGAGMASRIVQFFLENAELLFGISNKSCLVRDKRSNRGNLTNIYAVSSPLSTVNTLSSHHPPAPDVPLPPLPAIGQLQTSLETFTPTKSTPPAKPEKPKIRRNDSLIRPQSVASHKYEITSRFGRGEIYEQLGEPNPTSSSPGPGPKRSTSFHVSAPKDNSQQDLSSDASLILETTDPNSSSNRVNISSTSFDTSRMTPNHIQILPEIPIPFTHSPSDVTLKRKKSRPPPPVPSNTNLNDEKLFPLAKEDDWYIPVTQPEHEFPRLPANCLN